MMPLTRLGALLMTTKPLSPIAPLVLLKVIADPVFAVLANEASVICAVPLLGVTASSEAPELSVTLPTWATPLVPDRLR